MLKDTDYKEFFEELIKMASDGVIGLNRHVQKSNVQKFNTRVSEPSERNIMKNTRINTQSNSRMVDRRLLNKPRAPKIA